MIDCRVEVGPSRRCARRACVRLMVVVGRVVMIKRRRVLRCVTHALGDDCADADADANADADGRR